MGQQHFWTVAQIVEIKLLKPNFVEPQMTKGLGQYSKIKLRFSSILKFTKTNNLVAGKATSKNQKRLVERNPTSSQTWNVNSNMTKKTMIFKVKEIITFAHRLPRSSLSNHWVLQSIRECYPVQCTFYNSVQYVQYTSYSMYSIHYT